MFSFDCRDRGKGLRPLPPVPDTDDERQPEEREDARRQVARAALAGEAVGGGFGVPESNDNPQG
jgi:hypothetical protein